MEPMEILGLAQKNIFGDPVGAFQGAQRGALNNQQAQMQNLQMMLGMQDKQRLRDIAPQLGQAISGSGMPMAEQFGMLVEADPTKAEFALRESMDYSIAQAKRQMMNDPINSQLINEAMADLSALETSAMILLDPKQTSEARELALKNYTISHKEFTEGRANLAQRVQNASLVDGILPKNVMRPSELLTRAEELGFKRKGIENQEKSQDLAEKSFNLRQQEFEESKASRKRDELKDIDERTFNALEKQGLMTPDRYNIALSDALTAKSNDNIFMAVKLLSQAIEPKLSVTEGEVSGYTVGGDSRFDRFVKEQFGSSAKDLETIYNMSLSLINERKKLAENVIRKKGDIFGTRRDEGRKKSGDTPKKSVKGLKRF